LNLNQRGKLGEEKRKRKIGGEKKAKTQWEEELIVSHSILFIERRK